MSAGDAMQRGVDAHDAEQDARRQELAAWAKTVVGRDRDEHRDPIRSRDLYLEMLGEEILICEEALAVARRKYQQVFDWREPVREPSDPGAGQDPRIVLGEVDHPRLPGPDVPWFQAGS